MPDHDQYLLLCAEAVYTVPVGTDMYRRRITSDVQKWSTTRVKEQLNKKSIKYNWHEADVTVLEGVSGARRPESRTGYLKGL